MDGNTGIQSYYQGYSDHTGRVGGNTPHGNPGPEIPGRYRGAPHNLEQDPNLASDLQRTRTKGRRRTRRSRKSVHHPNNPDTDEGGALSDGSSVNEDYEVDSIPSTIEEQLTWRGRMQSALHHHYFHFIIVILVSLDALIVLFELLLDVGAFGNRQCDGETVMEETELCHYRTPETCAPSAFQVLEGANISSLDLIEGTKFFCSCKFRTGKFVCDFINTPRGINPGDILHIMSLFILTIFMAEIVVKMVAFRMKYFTHKFEVFDGAIVVISWVLDIASLVEEEAFETAASLIIILRLWRVVRIVNGAILSSKAQSDKDLEEAREEARKIIHALHKCQDKLDAVTSEKQKLTKRLEALQGPGGNKRKNY